MTENPLNDIHISLGLDCTLAYQLKNHNLRKFALPFDWSRIRSIKDLVEILDADFFNFLNPNEWIQEKQSDNFVSCYDIQKKSKIRLKHKKYNIMYRHESIDDFLDLDMFLEKYSRRIDRFRNFMKNQSKNKSKNYKKIYIYIGVDKINKTDYERLLNCITKNYNILNFELILINYSEYKCEIEFNWKRDYINFADLFKN